MNGRKPFAIISIALVFVIVAGTAVFLHGQERYSPAEKYDGPDVQRSRVYLTGTGYTIDKQQDKTQKKQEKEKEKQKTEKKKENPEKKQPKKARKSDSVKKIQKERSASGNRKRAGGGSTDPTNPSGGGGGDEPDDPTNPSNGGGGGNQISEDEAAKKPNIRISISNGQRLTGTRVNFTVRVTDYKGRNVPVFSEDDGSYMAACNGEQLVSVGSSGGETSFRAQLLDGDNEIYVTAVDREGNTNERRIRFTGDTGVEAEVTGEVYVAIEAPILNLGTIYDTTVNIHPGDTAKDILEEAFAQAGITPYFNGGYLAGIGKAGIAQGASIDDGVRDIMMERRKTEKDPEKQDKDKLREHDFYDSSGWIYIVNGEAPEVGMNSYRMEDGDEIHLVFQLDTDVY